MDYTFRRDVLGEPEVQMSMGCEALAQWLSTEISTNQSAITQLFVAIDKIENKQTWEQSIESQDFFVTLAPDGIEVRSKLFTDESIAFDDFSDEAPDLLEDDSDTQSYEDYNSELYTQYGLEDFKALLSSWKNFINQ